MPENYESNWDNLARQLGFEPEDQVDNLEEPDSENEVTGSEAAEKDTSFDLTEQDSPDRVESVEKNPEIEPEDSIQAKESIADFFEPSQANETDKETKDAESQPADHSQPESGGDHWGSLAGTLGLENEPGEEATAKAENGIPELSSPVLDPESDNQTEDSESPVESTESSDGVETVEFDIQDLSDADDDRPRRRRKKRRRRRAVIEELREELEREKEEESVDEQPANNSDDSSSKHEPIVEPTAKHSGENQRAERQPAEDQPDGDQPTEDKSPEKRRRRRRERTSNQEESEAQVSKNQRRRKRRVRSDESEDDQNDENGDSSQDPKPERKFPTWEEAIHPVVEANINRVAQKPRTGKRRRTKSRDSN